MLKSKADADTTMVLERSILEVVDRTKAVFLAHAPTIKRKNNADDHHTMLLNRLKEYEEAGKSKDNTGTIVPSSMSLSASKEIPEMVKMCGLAVPYSTLTKPGDKGSVKDIENTLKLLKAMKENENLGTMSNFCDNIPLFFDKGLQSLSKCVGLLSNSALDSGRWASVPNGVFDLLRTVMRKPLLGDLLKEKLETVNRMMFDSDALEQEQQKAVADGEMKLSEKLYLTKIALQEDMNAVFDDIFNVIEEHRNSCFQTPMKETHTVHNTTNDIIYKMIKDQESLRKAVQTDIKKVNETSLSMRASDMEVRNIYTGFLEKSDQSLFINHTQTEECFKAILEIEKRITELADEKIQLVKNRVDVIKQESQRQVQLRRFEEFMRHRTELLIATEKTCDVADEVTDIVDELICSACNSLEYHLRVIDGDINKHQNDVNESRLAHFRGLYLTLGELQYKKERTLQELDKKIANTHIKQDIAMDTLNPKAKEYAQMKKELLKVREEMDSQLEIIREKAQLQIEAFKPIEQYLIMSGKEFLHPVDELQMLNTSRQQKLLEYRKLMSSHEEGENECDSTLFESDVEVRAMQEAMNDLQPRKPTGKTGVRV
eukprot:Tbor_TRINITY_DN3146_c0_g1::TRINITY_DN3146_c0_g1_i1::g.14710::m.14710